VLHANRKGKAKVDKEKQENGGKTHFSNTTSQFV
jgi:hypothetical protein